MLRVVIAAVLLGHGIGHSMGLLQALKIATVNPTWAGDSWVLTGIAGPTLTQAVGAILWTAAIVGFAALAAIVVSWLPPSWWQPLAIGSAFVSMLGLLLFPVAFPTLSSIGALAVNLALLVTVLGYHWAPSVLAA